eukprot:2771882-Rhodomonas_salina.1
MRAGGTGARGCPCGGEEDADELPARPAEGRGRVGDFLQRLNVRAAPPCPSLPHATQAKGPRPRRPAPARPGTLLSLSPAQSSRGLVLKHISIWG